MLDALAQISLHYGALLHPRFAFWRFFDQSFSIQIAPNLAPE